jgi:hypothetical protein
MGNILEARCKCGYRNDRIAFGRNMFSPPNTCYAPAFNTVTNTLEVVNYGDFVSEKITYAQPVKWYRRLLGEKTQPPTVSYELTSSPYKFYNDPELQSDGSRTSREIRNYDFVMYERENYCPYCKQFTLDFNAYIYTD